MAKRQRPTLKTRVELYATRSRLSRDAQEEMALRIPFKVYFKDPLYAKENPGDAIDPDFLVPWEPGLLSGPTSARFAVVDYDATTNALTPPATWDRKQLAFLSDQGEVLDDPAQGLQFHQVSVWARLQHTLDYFESGFGLGRRITWGFEGNRLIVVPHAGYGENAYYDRGSKSLQFYWFDREDGRIYTCLSSDIVNHEFAHAVLDGLRPHYLEAVTPETAAFHEFIGDVTAILMAFRNNSFRNAVLRRTGGDLKTDTLLSRLAQQFGEAVTGQPYLRSARNDLTMGKVAGDLRPHHVSQVLTGAMFDIIQRLSGYYQERQKARYAANPARRKPSLRTAFWNTIQRMQTMAIQPLDLLPPCEVTFRDYALAVLRAEQVANPTDPDGYRAMMIDVFIARGILDAGERDGLLALGQVFDRLALDVFHPAEAIAASRGNAYRFLDDNRDCLFIPASADLVVSDLVQANKLTREARQLPRQLVLQYVWREDLELAGDRFGRFAGQSTTLLCGATLVLDQNGNVIHWARKPGTQPVGDSAAAKAEQEAGRARRAAYLDALAARIGAGMVGESIGSPFGLLANAIPPFTARLVDGTLRFELSPHFAIHDEADTDVGGRQWQISS